MFCRNIAVRSKSHWKLVTLGKEVEEDRSYLELPNVVCGVSIRGLWSTSLDHKSEKLNPKTFSYLFGGTLLYAIIHIDENNNVGLKISSFYDSINFFLFFLMKDFCSVLNFTTLQIYGSHFNRVICHLKLSLTSLMTPSMFRN